VNARLDTVQAAILNVKLPRLGWPTTTAAAPRASTSAAWPASRRRRPEGPDDEFAHIYHLFVIRTSRRDELQRFLNQQGIQTGIHYRSRSTSSRRTRSLRRAGTACR